MPLPKLAFHLRGLWASRSGTFAMATAVVAVPLLLAVGLGVDLSMVMRAKSRMQEASDGAALAMAASPRKSADDLQKVAETFLHSNLDVASVGAYAVQPVASSGDDVTVRLTAAVDVAFMKLAGIDSVPVAIEAVATRAVKGSVEVSLVLDNTWSMSETDANGVQKIAALRDSAGLLVNQLFSTSGANVRVAVVPYADYVNVGADNRHASWMAVPADTSTTTPRTCKQIASEEVCVKYKPSYSCQTTTDGVTTTGTCKGECEEKITRTYDPPKESCSGGTTSTSTFYGCVGSRKTNAVRLADGSPSVTYPGFIGTSQRCPLQILPLTGDKEAILASIARMTPNNGSYKPSTYIPAGLIWGLNTLSQAAPFTEGLAYDAENVSPRKVLVLMTDGDNTLRYNAAEGKDSSNGTHVAISANADGSLTAAGVTQLAATNADTRTLCDNIKAASRRIEVFTVALAVDNDAARNILQGCASNEAGTLDHYYDATDAKALAAAFSGIAQKLSLVRLKK